VTLVTLLALESVLHLMDVPPDRDQHQRFFVEHDSLRGWRSKPGTSGEFVTDEYRVQLRYNSRGLRGPEVAADKPVGTKRVIVLGDSFVEAYSVDEGERVSDVMETLLNEGLSEPVFEVIALGTAGYATDQEYLWLIQEGLAYDPDLVVLMFHPNDVWYNTRTGYGRGSKPRFLLDGDSLLLTGVPVPQPEDAGGDPGFYGWLRDNSKIYWLLANAIKMNPRLHGWAVRRGLAAMPPEMVFDSGDDVPIPAEFMAYREELTPETREAWIVTGALLGRMREVVESRGAGFLAFFIPLRGAIYTQELAVRSRFGLSAEGWDPGTTTARFLEICREEGLRCIDPSSRFLEIAEQLVDEGERLYYRFDWHWNAAGHRLAAEILSDSILADSILTRADSVDSIEED
jgi:hypothetical protein